VGSGPGKVNVSVGVGVVGVGLGPPIVSGSSPGPFTTTVTRAATSNAKIAKPSRRWDVAKLPPPRQRITDV
jgi:hypothetical protein